MAQQVNISWYKGEDATLTFSLTLPVSVSGWNCAFTVRDRLGGTILIQKTTALGSVTINNAALGVFQVAIVRADTATSSSWPAVGYYDFTRVDAGFDTCLAIGTCQVRPNPYTP